MDRQIKHRTFVFERSCKAGSARVFAAFSDSTQRATWSAPSESAAVIYDVTDFREGGRDVFRCGDKDDPQYTGIATYVSIVPNSRIVWSEIVESGSQTLAALLNTVLLEAHVDETRVCMTVQATSFCGDEMFEGIEAGNNAALDNLVAFVAR
ncbi:SRPBCC domain-containing protein [Xanthomonas sp. LF06-19]|uniref:SRPBCC domain-containing protein n=1 Tax=Xanthomonas sp. LF06-19 TaxID=3097551 RepID=UPI0024CCF8FC|nr:SRPBCC domain-containing protein [Xanthomonas sp. LF06-19]MDY4281905.1 SRPBCC domain-containing protein [Xanthomonas sp. LF06-19]UYK75816.1 SRPBCC domain-containing protein [Xanthomonas sacchari]